MRYLVDGYNITRRDPATASLPLCEQREALLVRLATRGADLLGVGPIVIVFDGVAFWPKPQVLVAMSSRPAPEAAALAARLWEGLVPLGIPPDFRPFKPHVTLARKVVKPAAELSLKPVRWPVSALTLVESVTDPDGSRYTPI